MTPSPQVRQGGEALRTWTLTTQGGEPTLKRGVPQAKILYGKTVTAIELEPVLDLLERLMPAYEREAWDPTDFEIEALLREHGRLS